MTKKINKFHIIGLAVMLGGITLSMGLAFLAHSYHEYDEQAFWAGIFIGVLTLVAGTVVFFKGGPYKTQSLSVAIISWLFSLAILIIYFIPFVLERYRYWDLDAALAGSLACMAVAYLPVFYTVNYLVSPKEGRKP